MIACPYEWINVIILQVCVFFISSNQLHMTVESSSICYTQMEQIFFTSLVVHEIDKCVFVEEWVRSMKVGSILSCTQS